MLSALVESLLLKLKLASVALVAAVIGARGAAAAATIVTVLRSSGDGRTGSGGARAVPQ